MFVSPSAARSLLVTALLLLLAPGAAYGNKCVKGQPCGDSCISWDKVCHVDGSGWESPPGDNARSELPNQGQRPQSSGANDRRIDDAIIQLEAGKPLSASLSLHGLLASPWNLEEGQLPKVHYYFARSIRAAGLPVASLRPYRTVLELGPTNPEFKYALAAVADIAQSTHHVDALLDLPKYYAIWELPRRGQAMTHEITAWSALRGGSYEEALQELREAAKLRTHPTIRSLLLEGHASAALSQVQQALDAYTEVIVEIEGLRRSERTPTLLSALDIAYLDRARLEFCQGSTAVAGDDFKKVSRGSRHHYSARYEGRLAVATPRHLSLRWIRSTSRPQIELTPAGGELILWSLTAEGGASDVAEEASRIRTILAESVDQYSRIAAALDDARADYRNIDGIWEHRRDYFLPSFLGDDQRAFFANSPQRIAEAELQKEIRAEREVMEAASTQWRDVVGYDVSEFLDGEMLLSRLREILVLAGEWHAYIAELSAIDTLGHDMTMSLTQGQSQVSIPCLRVSMDIPHGM